MAIRKTPEQIKDKQLRQKIIKEALDEILEPRKVGPKVSSQSGAKTVETGPGTSQTIPAKPAE